MGLLTDTGFLSSLAIVIVGLLGALHLMPRDADPTFFGTQFHTLLIIVGGLVSAWTHGSKTAQLSASAPEPFDPAGDSRTAVAPPPPVATDAKRAPAPPSPSAYSNGSTYKPPMLLLVAMLGATLVLCASGCAQNASQRYAAALTAETTAYDAVHLYHDAAMQAGTLAAERLKIEIPATQALAIVDASVASLKTFSDQYQAAKAANDTAGITKANSGAAQAYAAFMAAMREVAIVLPPAPTLAK